MHLISTIVSEETSRDCRPGKSLHCYLLGYAQQPAIFKSMVDGEALVTINKERRVRLLTKGEEIVTIWEREWLVNTNREKDYSLIIKIEWLVTFNKEKG